MYLVDTNVWLERILDQARSDEVGRFLSRIPSERLAMSDFALHSIGVVLSRLNKAEALLRLVQDAFIDGAVTIVRLEPDDLARVVSLQAAFSLDFDDAYQYAAAEKQGLTPRR